MRCVVQRVQSASVTVEGETVARIGAGLLVLVGITREDGEKQVDWTARKIPRLRVFDDEEGVMNRSLVDVGGELLLVSQFTLHADLRKGNRPSYNKAAGADHAVPVYEALHRRLEQEIGSAVPTGVFGSEMLVSLVNDGPVTLIVDTETPGIR